MSDTLTTSNISEAQSSKAEEIKPTPDSFFNLTLVSFQVENTVFRVPKHGFLIPETIFESMFSLPSSNGEGSSNENPIKLDGIEEGPFRSLLRVMYPFIEQPPVVDFDDWVGVLGLSTLWEFNQIRTKAITALSNQIDEKDVLRRIHLARKYKVVDWLRNAYVELVQKDSLKLEELTEALPCLDWPTIARIFCIRDGYRQPTSGVSSVHGCGRNHGQSMCPYGYSMPQPLRLDLNSARERVDEFFREEMERAKEV